MDKEQIIAKRKTKLIFLENNQVVKEFDPLFPKSSVLNEALNHSMVEESGLSVPRLIDIKLEGAKRSITMEYIHGHDLETIMKKDAKNIQRHIDFMVDVELEMHSKKVEGLKKIKDKYGDKLCKAPYDATTRYELFNLLEKLPTHTKLCHGDFNPSNIVITEDGKKYILDWAHASQGNASADAAQSYLILYLNYGGIMAEKYLNLFVAQSGIAKKTIQKWLPVVAAAKTLNCQEEELDFLNRWVNVVEYE